MLDLEGAQSRAATVKKNFGVRSWRIALLGLARWLIVLAIMLPLSRLWGG